MAFEKALTLEELPEGSKKAIKLGDTEILVIHTVAGTLHAVEAKCPHAGAPLEQGAVCDGRLICPWHAATYELNGDALPEGTLLEPPALRSLKHYAAKIEGDSILVEPKPMNSPSLGNYNDDAPAQPVGADQHIVTIGGGAASTAAITALRQGGFAGRITVVDPVDSEPVDRTNLSKMTLAGKKPTATLPLWKPEELAKLLVEQVRERVVKLDGAAGTLTTDAGHTLQFDGALLATGGEPKKLGIPGEDLKHVHSIRHIADVEAISGLIGAEPKEKRAVLLGDSFIAFEAASALTTRGLKVTVVSRSEKPFSKKFGDEAAGALVGLHQKNGVTLKLGAEAEAITVAGVKLKSGETLPADIVIVAIGVKVATDFEHGLKVEKDGGVPVTRSLRIADRLWVAGDAASVDGTRIEHWRLAEQHGRAAAASMLSALAPGGEGQSTEGFHGVPFFWTAHFGKRFGYVGHANEWDEIKVDGSLDETKFLAYYVKSGKVAAVLGCGMDSGIAMLAESMRKPLSLEQAQKAAASA